MEPYHGMRQPKERGRCSLDELEHEDYQGDLYIIRLLVEGEGEGMRYVGFKDNSTDLGSSKGKYGDLQKEVISNIVVGSRIFYHFLLSFH